MAENQNISACLKQDIFIVLGLKQGSVAEIKTFVLKEYDF